MFKIINIVNFVKFNPLIVNANLELNNKVMNAVDVKLYQKYNSIKITINKLFKLSTLLFIIGIITLKVSAHYININLKPITILIYGLCLIASITGITKLFTLTNTEKKIISFIKK